MVVFQSTNAPGYHLNETRRDGFGFFCWNEIPFRFETLVNKNVDSSKSNHCLVIDSKWEWLEFSEYVANGACCFDDKRFDSFHWFE